jgi:beta-lactamase class A
MGFAAMTKHSKPLGLANERRRKSTGHRLARFAFGLLLALGATHAQAVELMARSGTVKAANPSQRSDPGYGDLLAGKDARIQAALEVSLKKLALDRAVRDGRLAAALVDITDPAHPRMAQVNGDRMMYAASLPKIAILLGAFQKAAEARLTLDAAAVAELTQMIRSSSNSAASAMLQRVGMDYLAKVLQSERYRLYDPALNGGLWVGKPYGAGAAGRRDPLHNISHGATAYQVARFYYLMETGQLVSPDASRQMKEIMSSPAMHHKFVKGLAQSHPDAQLYRKSGTWRTFHADSAIVERGGRRYIAVGLADDPMGGEWLRALIVAMDDIVFSSEPRPL